MSVYLIMASDFRLSRCFVNKSQKRCLGFLICGFVFIFLYFKLIHIYTSKPSYVNLKMLLKVCIVAAQRGGMVVKEVRELNLLNSTSKGKTQEGANDPLTQGDILSHIQMFNSLKLAFPLLKIISEEHVTKKLSNIYKIDTSISNFKSLPDQIINIDDITVWIDPLDATQEYTENLLQYVTTMVCVAIKGVPTIGVIYKPFENRDNKLYWAWVGKGNSNNLKIHTKNDKRTIIISRSHSGETKQKISDLFGDDNKIVSAGGAGYKILELVNGGADIYLHTTYIKKWDICPGNAILDAIGGNLTDLKGKRINYSHDVDYVMRDGLLAYGPH